MQNPSIASSSQPAWTLAKGAAQTLYARTDGVLRVQSGRAWVTVTVPTNSPQPRWRTDLSPGDVFVQAGGVLALQAGQTAVVESWPLHADQTTALEWQAAARSAGAERWQPGVVVPLREAGAAAVLMAQALMRVVAGLAGYTAYFIAGRGKVLSTLESNAP